MNTLYELLEYGKEQLQRAGVTEYEWDAWYLLQYVTGVDRTRYLCDRNCRVPEEQTTVYRELIGKRTERIPLQQITHEQEFMGLPFYINEHVLIPRQDTEVLVEEAGKLLKERKKAKLLDMCTGSGCILISLVKRYGAEQAVGVDISEEALRVASYNAEKNQVEVVLQQSDLFSKVNGRYDIIVSNPPYIRTSVIAALEPEVREHEPVLALDGREDGLYFYRRITEQAGKFLNPGGYLIFEIGHDQGDEVSQLLVLHGYTEVRVIRDLAGLDRVCMGKMEE